MMDCIYVTSLKWPDSKKVLNQSENQACADAGMQAKPQWLCA
jgi:hypothetical protein